MSVFNLHTLHIINVKQVKNCRYETLFLVFLFAVRNDVDQVLVIQVSSYIWWECCEHLFHLWTRRNTMIQLSELINGTDYNIARYWAITSSGENLSAWVASISVTLWRQAVMKSTPGIQLIQHHQCNRQMLTSFALMFPFLQGQTL